MADTKLLRKWINEKGLKLKAIAATMGVAPYTLQKKIENRTEFKASEISVFVNDYGMTPEMRDLIFFTHV